MKVSNSKQGSLTVPLILCLCSSKAWWHTATQNDNLNVNKSPLKNDHRFQSTNDPWHAIRHDRRQDILFISGLRYQSLFKAVRSCAPQVCNNLLVQ